MHVLTTRYTTFVVQTNYTCLLSDKIYLFFRPSF